MANGFLYIPRVGKNVIVDLADHKPQAHKPKAYKINLHTDDIHHYQFDIDGQSQIETVQAQCFDISKQKLSESSKAKTGPLKIWDKADATLKPKPLSLRTNIPMSGNELQQWANAQKNFRLLDCQRGCLSLAMNASSPLRTIALGDKINLEGFGELFKQDYLVCGIEHEIDHQQWLMHLRLGLPLALSLQSDAASLAPLPMMIGKVAKFKADAEKLERIPIAIPSLNPGKIIWARLLSPFASKEEGLFFQPNAGDEVLVEFIEGDCRYPVIVGSCHNPKNRAPMAFADKPPKQGMFFKDKDKKPISVVLDNQTPSLVISSGGKNTIVMDDKQGIVARHDKSQLLVAKAVELLGGETVTIESKKAMSLKAGAKVEVDAAGLNVK